MFLLRLILLFCLVCFTSLGKADKQGYAKVEGKICKEKSEQPKHEISKENKERNTGLKRKLKPKGTEVTVPNLGPTNFTQKHSYTQVYFLSITHPLSYPFFDSNGKRGPPAFWLQ